MLKSFWKKLRLGGPIAWIMFLGVASGVVTSYIGIFTMNEGLMENGVLLMLSVAPVAFAFANLGQTSGSK